MRKEDLLSLTQDEVDALPFGLITLDPDAVKEFAGLYREMVSSGRTQSWEFNFLFRFAAGDKRVHIQLAYFPEQQRGLIMVQSPSAS
jgi:hypothetical protein